MLMTIVTTALLSQGATLQAAVPRTIGPLYRLSCGELRGARLCGEAANESGAPPDASDDASSQNPGGSTGVKGDAIQWSTRDTSPSQSDTTGNPDTGGRWNGSRQS